MASSNNSDRQKQLNSALDTLKAGGSVYLNKYSRAIMVDGKIVSYNPEVANVGDFRAGNARLTKEKLAAAVAAGKGTIITQADLAAAINPKPTVPKPVGSDKPKTKVKGSADDDRGKKKPISAEKKNNPKLRTTADPELTTGKRLKNPLGALSSYTYQLTLYMVTPDALETFKQDGFKSISKLGDLLEAQDNIEGAAIGPGAYIVAQSGGVNKYFEQRAPSFAFDYGIDNLSFEVAGPQASGSAAAEFNFNFTIIEPYGFSFISNLKRASEAIKDYQKRIAKKRSEIAKKKLASEKQRGKPAKPADNVNRQAAQTSSTAPQTNNTDTNTGSGSTATAPQDPTSNLFVLGIRFFGYNASGKPVKGTDTTAATNQVGQVIYDNEDNIVTQAIDPGNDTYSLFERFYPIILSEVKTTLDGRMTKYDCVATGYSMQAFGTKRGMINNKIEVQGNTVGEMLDDLMKQLNKEQKTLNNDSGSNYSYSVKYASEPDRNRIRSSKIVSSADLDKYKWPGSGATKAEQSNASTEVTANNTPKNNKRRLTIADGTPILQAINQIIAQSSFLQDALKIVFTTALEPDPNKTDDPALDLTGQKTIEWFHCIPDISNFRWNDNTADWVYDIDYILNVYDTPILDTAYTNPGKQYYGPVKRYEYWYTGTNSEILQYQQVLDKNFYTTFLGDAFGKSAADSSANKNGGTNTTDATNGSGNAAGVTAPLVQNQKTGQPTQGKQGLGMEAQNSYLTSLFDINAQATATVTILGDPDWLMSTTAAVYNNKGEFGASLAQNESLVYNKFYGRDGYSISPGGGQVFFEIDFKEAIDYKSEGIDIPTKDGSGVSGAPGTLSINSSILFWKDPKSVSKLVRGLSYSCYNVKSEFRNGQFRQILTGHINTFGDSGSIDNGTGRENNSTSSNSGTNTGSNGTTSNQGFRNSNFDAAWKKEESRRQNAIDKNWQEPLQKNPSLAPPRGAQPLARET